MQILDKSTQLKKKKNAKGQAVSKIRVSKRAITQPVAYRLQVVLLHNHGISDRMQVCMWLYTYMKVLQLQSIIKDYYTPISFCRMPDVKDCMACSITLVTRLICMGILV